MALKPQISFSAGELDPILFDRATLERFQNAVHTGRNVIVGKQGTFISRFGRFFYLKTKYENAPVKIFCPPSTGLVLEVGYDPATGSTGVNGTYVRLYDYGGNLINEYVTTGTGLTDNRVYFEKSNLATLHFQHSGNYVYFFEGSNGQNRLLRLELVAPYTIRSGQGAIPGITFPSGAGWTVNYSGTGYQVDYAISLMKDNQESLTFEIVHPTHKKPINPAEQNDIIIDFGVAVAIPSNYNEIRIYQRPNGGASYGYLGRSTNFYLDTGHLKAKFSDVGSDPDYTQSTVSDIVNDAIGNNAGLGMFPGTGIIYQQRLVLGNLSRNGTVLTDESILASRPGFQSNFYRDFPYTVDSALNFKAGASGKAKVLRFVEYNGIVVFTSIGVFVNEGILSPQNTTLVKRGKWIIDETVAPLLIPGGMFFVEKGTGAIKQLVFSNELQTYDSVEQTIFSGHLFKKRTVKSWAFQDGLAPMIIVTFSDGKFATFTYSYEQQMKAWTRHDSVYPVEQVEETGESDLSFFVVNKDGARYIEGTVPRYISPSVYSTDPEADKKSYGALMDAMVVTVHLINDSLAGADNLVLTPVTLGNWSGNLTLTCGTSGLFPSPGDGAVGSVIRWFHPIDKSVLDLTVVSRTSNNSIVVSPSEDFPSEYATGPRLYRTHTTVSGLSHLNNEEVSVMCDGDVISSPYNDSPDDSSSIPLTVVAGSLTLPNRSAITIVGRPVVADIKTLNVTTAEQSPTTLESMTANKMYVRTHETRGLFVANKFPENKTGDVDGNSVEGMQSLDDYFLDNDENEIIGNRSKQPTSRRHEITLAGEFNSQAQVAFRQVDPLHFEILSIILDIEIMKRSDR